MEMFIHGAKMNFYNQQIINIDDPIREAFTFNGWYLDKEFTKLFDINDMPAYDISLYPKWDINTYTIFYETNGGNAIESNSQEYKNSVIAPNDPIKEGHSFIGWYIDEELSTEYKFSTMPSNDFTIYAKWEINQYSIDYYDVGSVFDVIEVGMNHSIGLTSDNKIYAWGSNLFGQIGDGTYYSKSSPVKLHLSLIYI